MNIYRSIEDYARAATRDAAVTIGNFDGVHSGHAALLSETVKRARAQGLDSVAVTFEPHPRLVLSGRAPEPIMSVAQKARVAAALGIDVMLVAPFTREFSQTSAHDFAHDWIGRQLRAKSVIVGYDFRFGRRGTGTPEVLRQAGSDIGFEVVQLDARTVNGMEISSTLLRDMLQRGEIDRANRLMVFPYAVGGPVVHGAARGRDLGFPTANLAPDIDPLLPAGIYGGFAVVDGQRRLAAISLGFNPTFERLARPKPNLEAYLLDFDRSVYGHTMELTFLSHVRKEKKFDDISELVQQIGRDVDIVRASASQNEWDKIKLLPPLSAPAPAT